MVKMKSKDKTIRKHLNKLFDKNLKYHEFMKFHTTFRVGGPADYYITPIEFKNLVEALKLFREHNIPVTVLGAGSNLLIKDSGIKGVVFNFCNLTDYILVKEDNIFAGSGVNLTKLSRTAADHGLSGLEWASSIPGTVGGAVKGNAGAFQRTISDNLTAIDGVDLEGNSKFFHNTDLDFGYRSSNIPDDFIILNVSLKLERDDPDKIQETMKEYINRRIRTQPIGTKSAGSIFKNPFERYAGELIEKAGLKGYRFKGAKISQKHANFIINEEGASASDILNLIDLVKTTVFNKFGIKLELEIKIIGE